MLDLAQRDSPILDAICSFLRENVSACSGLYVHQVSAAYYRCSISRREASLVLHRLVSAGLLQKRNAAEHVRTATFHASVRVGSENNKGNQSRYKKLDSDGCERARHINTLNTRLRKARLDNLYEHVQQLQTRIAVARLDHAVRTLQCRIHKVRLDIAWLTGLHTSNGAASLFPDLPAAALELQKK